MVLDVLDTLEWYRVLHPRMQGLITILDRSLPYDDEPGSYTVDGITYEVVSYTTDALGKVETALETEVHVLLEGEELISLQENGLPRVVNRFSTGMFVLFHPQEQYRHRQMQNSTTAVKKVVFRLPVLPS